MIGFLVWTGFVSVNFIAVVAKKKAQNCLFCSFLTKLKRNTVL
jgi:hypothetical protein